VKRKENQELTITGTFNNNADHVSGIWTEVVYGSTFSGSWEADF